MRLSDRQRTDGRDPRLDAVLNAPDAPEVTLTCRRCFETLPARWWACGDVSCPMKDAA